MWPDRRILDSVGIEHPIVQAPMIGPKPALAGHVTAAGGPRVHRRGGDDRGGAAPGGGGDP
jgi:NAD(P)H-dependent flavin oxidoreductase YrpB (nitropropane dioxygenase family)